MHRVLYLLALGLILTISGCDSNEPPKAQAPPVTPQAAAPAEEKAPASAAAEADKAPAVAETAGTAVVAGATAVVEQVKETTAAATESASKMADKTVAGAAAVTASAKAAITPATVPQELVLEASYGNVTFPHGMHAEAYKCATCHGDKTPAKFGLTKDIAHVLCKDCHKQEGAPNGCKDCHKK